MAGKGLKLQKMVGQTKNDCKWLDIAKIAGNGWKQLEQLNMAENDLTWLEGLERGSKGQKWLDLARIAVVAAMLEMAGWLEIDENAQNWLE